MLHEGVTETLRGNKLPHTFVSISKVNKQGTPPRGTHSEAAVKDQINEDATNLHICFVKFFLFFFFSSKFLNYASSSLIHIC